MEIQFNVPEEVSYVLGYLNRSNHSAELVGGCVRDHLLGRDPSDYDICTSAHPHEVHDLFQGHYGVRVLDTGTKHGTVTVMMNGTPIEVTTYRADGIYSDGRRPDSVEFSESVKEDVSRRDFTINGLLWDGEKVVDYTQTGLTDLKYKMICTIGDPEARFREDALRMLRAVRFAAQLNFTLSSDVAVEILLLRAMIKNVSTERIQMELNKLLVSNHPGKGLSLLYELGLLEIILPEIHRLKHFDQMNPRHNKDVFDHTLKVVESVPATLEMRLAALFHDVGKPDTFSVDGNGVGHFYEHHKVGADLARVILKRLLYPNETVDTVCSLVYEHMSGRSEGFEPGTKALKRLMNRIGVERMPMFFDMRRADIIGHAPPYDFAKVLRLELEFYRILEHKEPLKVTDLVVDGHTLIKRGLKPGPEFSQILNQLLSEVLEDPERNNADYLLRRIDDIYERGLQVCN